MARYLLVALALICGCGRIGYDELDGNAGDGLTLSYPSTDVTAVVGVTVVSMTPTVSREVSSFTIAPSLPTGVVIDPASGVIAGIPMQPADGVRYTVTASDGDASARFGFRLTSLPGVVVDVTADFPDDNGGADPLCFATPAGGCTLRAAVQTANRRATAQVVLLGAGVYALGSALETIANSVVIAGQGVTATTIRAAAIQPGYGMLALASAHTLALRQAGFRDFGMADGAVVNVTAGTLEVDGCDFVNNASAGSGGVFFVAAGARATIRTSTFTGNASFGGCCGGWGGVIDGEGQGTTIVIDGCTATANRSAWGSFAHITTGTTLRLENSTLYGNLSTTAGTLATPGGVYTLINDTIASNTNTSSSPESAGLYLFEAPGHYVVANTIVAFNTDVTGGEHNCNRRDLLTSLTSEGGNLFSDGAGNCGAYVTAAGDRLDTDPGLEPGAPGNHGGPTPTILLTPSSAAIDGAQTARCPSIDQRGWPRPVAGSGTTALCDVGAVEMQ